MKLMNSKNCEGEHSPSWCEMSKNGTEKVVRATKTKNFLSNEEYEQFLDLQEELKFCECKKEKINSKVMESKKSVINKIFALTALYSGAGILTSYAVNVGEEFAPLLVVPAFALGVVSTYALDKLMQQHYRKQSKFYDEKSKDLKEKEGALYFKKVNETIAKSFCACEDVENER